MEDVRRMIDDRTWKQLSQALAQCKSATGSPPQQSDREFLEAVLFWARTGVPWRDLPSCFGKWDAVYQRFRRWQKTGTWQRLWQAVQNQRYRHAKAILVDSTVVRAHQHAAGAAGKKGGSRGKLWDVLVAA